MPADEDDEAASGPPPDPLDRIWLHPSELSQFEAEALTSGRERPRPSPWAVAMVSAVAGAVATMAVLLATGAIDGDESGDSTPASENAAARVVAAAGTSVVAVNVVGTGREARASGVSLGSGEVVTSAHVVRDAETVTVTGPDGLARTATIAGSDRQTGLALVRVDAPEWPSLPMDQDLEVGETVLALSAGHGDPWVSEGVVSAVDQAVPAGESVYAGMILTDTAAGKQARGGALFNNDGQVVGILASPPGASPSGLATPIDVAVDVATQLQITGEAVHGWLGVTGGTADEPAGALVYEVARTSPAAEAGLRQGDVIVALDGATVRNMAGLTSLVREHRPGETVPIMLIRDGEEVQVDCKLASGREDAVPPTTSVSTP
jgi:S1-C subfamily serine protease